MNAIIVLNYNDSEMVFEFVNKIFNYSILDKIIIVDNKSTDNSYERLQVLKSSKTDVIQTDHNAGYAAGNNYGIRYAEQKYKKISKIIISNPDITITETDMGKILDCLDEGYAMATGLIYNYNRKSQTKRLASNFGWMIPNYVDMISNCFLGIYKIRKSILKNSFYLKNSILNSGDIINTEAVPGCFFVIRDEAVRKIDYMEEDTFLFGEETILGWKLKSMGYKSAIVNHTTILHENSVSINKSIPLNSIKNKYRLNSEIVYLKKYLKCGALKIAIYKLIFWLGLVEKKIIRTII